MMAIEYLQAQTIFLLSKMIYSYFCLRRKIHCIYDKISDYVRFTCDSSSRNDSCTIPVIKKVNYFHLKRLDAPE